MYGIDCGVQFTPDFLQCMVIREHIRRYQRIFPLESSSNVRSPNRGVSQQGKEFQFRISSSQAYRKNLPVPVVGKLFSAQIFTGQSHSHSFSHSPSPSRATTLLSSPLPQLLPHPHPHLHLRSHPLHPLSAGIIRAATVSRLAAAFRGTNKAA